jgi:hypothetical protein
MGCTGNIPFKENNLIRLFSLWKGNGRDKGFGIGVPWRGKDALGFSHLDDPPKIHHGNGITGIANYSQIVGDKEISQAHFLLKGFQEIEHLGLDRNIES